MSDAKPVEELWRPCQPEVAAAAELLSQVDVASLPAEEIKELLLKALRQHPGRSGTPDAPVPTPPSVDFHVPLSDLKFKGRLGRGVAGCAHLAVFRGELVAVKMAHADTASVMAWRQETDLLEQLNHPNLVHCLGAVEMPSCYGTVLEYCAGGDVASALRAPHGTPPRFLLRVAKCVAHGLAYMHAMGVLHRDIKGANVLIDGSGTAKVGDLGLARRLPSGCDGASGGCSEGKLTAETGSYRWMARRHRSQTCKRER